MKVYCYKKPYEKRFAFLEVSDDEVVTLLDYPGYYRKIDLPIPTNRDKVLKDLEDEKFIYKNDGGSWDITNYGALMIATDFKKFDDLIKRSVRVIRYPDKSRLNGTGERVFSVGYAVSFDDIVSYILSVIPQEENIEGSIRKHRYAFPEMAIREGLLLR